MPFVQRVVQPTFLARPRAAQISDATSVSVAAKRTCIPSSKCSNNNCINQQQETSAHERETKEKGEFNGVARTTANTSANIDINIHNHHQRQTTKTTALVHQATIADSATGTQDEPDFCVAPLNLNHTNGFAASFSYATDNEEQPPIPGEYVGANTSSLLPMKKLKQHVEFLSTTSPTSSSARSGYNAGAADPAQTDRLLQRRQQQLRSAAAKIVPGYEFDSISNITLSNALRQLASLVLLASDIFEELQLGLQSVGDRSRAIQRKIAAVEKKVCAFDPKMVTVPESDLLTFAQRKTHYESDKTVRKELFTAETRPRSVSVLYEDAGKAYPPPPTSFASNNHDRIADYTGTGASQAAGSDELVYTPIFGKSSRKMRTRIDAEIEIRLPAAIEELRKWTSSEALGDVTVTPDCMHHVDTSINTSLVIGDNGILTPALSPSVLSADAVDALYSVNVSNVQDNTQILNDINKDVPLNHRLPSPEEQCKIIALRYPAELISVDTSGKRFERMCLARKSTTGCVMNIADSNNLSEEVQTVSRRSRSRKVRGKRRNTIAGIDEKEIRDAANGDSTATSSEIKNSQAPAYADADAEEGGDLSRRSVEKSKKFGRSKSSDILKKEAVALPYDKGKGTLTRLNSLKQWGRNRFRFMQRTDSAVSQNGSGLDASNSSQNTQNKLEAVVSTSAGDKPTKFTSARGDIDDEYVVDHRIGQKSEGRFSHERKPSYSSSEKSVSVTSCGHLKGKLHLATCGGNVKLRDTSSLNRQRRNGITINDLAGKEEQPHSSSGNWSASSESGRASIGSEITIQPKSSASNTSLNVSSFHPGSGPPSSMLSRRRFLNTSASSSVTSEGTTTPDLQVPTCDSYNNPLDDETSSAYSCDTEGYYTSFHMDSGLRTLKEEEPPMTPIQQGQASSYSFGSQSNQTVLSAENEYELYGRGSTSTTTSSAGTVCTTLMVNEHNNLTAMLGPDVPERSSSLANGGSDKLNRSNHSNSTSTLERSYSSSTIGSTLERTGTIKRNINAGLKLGVEEVDDSHQRSTTVNETPDSPEEEFDFEHRVRKRKVQPLPPTSSVVAELEYSESSDLEGVERIERIKLKTAINARRIPSMCIITPSTSDDENHAKDAKVYDPCRALLNTGNSVFSKAAKPEATQSNENSLYSKAVLKPETSLQFKINELTGYCTINMSPDNGITEAPPSPTKSVQHSTLSSPLPTEQPTTLAPDQQRDHNLNVLIKRSSHYGFNHMLEKLKVVLPNIKRSPSKGPSQLSAVVDDDELYDTAGEYVTIADISNNNRLQQPKAAIGLGIYYSNDIVRRSPPEIADDSATKANEPKSETRRETTEYISLDELPYHLRRIATSGGTDHKEACKNSTVVSANRLPSGIRECAESDSGQSVPMYAEITEQGERPLISPLTKNKGARIKLNAQGRIIYDSDSLKRRKGAHTTFAPGPYVKETESALAKNTVSAEFNAANSESGYNSEATKLLLLKQGGVNTRRNVANNITSPSSHPQPVIHSSYADIGSQPDNHTIPLLQAGESTMLPSPSTKSTSSTSSSTISSTNSTNTQVSTSSSSIASTKDEVYQRFYKASDQQPTSSATTFQRNSSVYWTLQHRKQPRGSATSVTCRDDLYATPIRRSERTAKAAALAASANIAANISPIVPRNRSSSVGFLTSTPTKVDWQHSADTIPRQRATRYSNWTNDSPERLETCADRIGQSKTSLMDFKKLLLAKSVKSSPVQKKFSAVELLKKPNAGATPTKTIGNTSSEDSLTPALPSSATLNSSMKVLDLSGSPKTFANRRMLRHGQFGSPSKSFGPKPRSSPCGWRGHNVVQRTDIMSTTIPEVNSEEDQSSANLNSSRSCSAYEFGDIKDRLQTTAADKFSLKHNFFLQTEENNFMRGELRKPFAKAMPLPQVGGGSNQYVSVPGLNRIVRQPSLVGTTNYSKATTAIDANEVGGRTTSALETAL